MNGAAAAAAAIAEATKASGAIVRVEPEGFRRILERSPEPLVVMAPGRILHRYHYLTSYKGLTFYTVSKARLDLPADAELVTAERIWVPG
jgi:hypothetical protein